MTVALIIAGSAHVGWTEATVTRSLETISGAFNVTLTEREPGETTPRTIRPGDGCRVQLDGDTVIQGYVDAVTVDYSATSHTIAVSGRDATGDLVDCSAATEPGEWHNERLENIAAALCRPFGIGVTREVDTGEPFRRFRIEEGESVFEAIERACRFRAVLPLSDGRGGLILGGPSRSRTDVRLERGLNIISASGTSSWLSRYRNYTLLGQQAGGMGGFTAEQVAHVKAEARDGGVTRLPPADDHRRAVAGRSRGAGKDRLGGQRAGGALAVGARHDSRVARGAGRRPLAAGQDRLRAGRLARAAAGLAHRGRVAISVRRRDAHDAEPGAAGCVRATGGTAAGRAWERVVELSKFQRLSRELRRRVLLMVGRAVFTVVNDETPLQTVQVEGLPGEIIDGAERFQIYGLTSHPLKGADALVLAVGGVRQHPVILVDDRRHRMKDLEEGEVALYTNNDDQHILLKADGSIELRAGAQPSSFRAAASRSTDRGSTSIDRRRQLRLAQRRRHDWAGRLVERSSRRDGIFDTVCADRARRAAHSGRPRLHGDVQRQAPGGHGAMPAVARIGDSDLFHCSTPSRAGGSSNVFCNGIGISRQGDNNSAHLRPPFPPPIPCPTHAAPIASGSSTVFVNGRGCGRVGDSISGCTSVASGSPNVVAG